MWNRFNNLLTLNFYICPVTWPLVYKRERFLDRLHLATILYLGVPLMLFFLSWLKVYFALIMIGAFLMPLFNYQYNLSLKGVKKWGIYFFIYGAFLLLLGFGEVFPQSGDWEKHNAIFSQLYQSWNQPVFVNYEGTEHILCYGLGFYMIPAWIAGFFNSFWLMPGLILINATIGVTLIGIWCQRVFKIPAWSVLLIFFISSLDWVMDIEYFQSLFISSDRVIGAICANQFLSRIDQTPHQGISTFLIFLVVWHRLQAAKPNYLLCLFMISLGFYWNPFLPFAMIPLLLFIKPKVFFEELKTVNLMYLLSIVMLLVVITGYYNFHHSPETISLRIWSLRQLVYPMSIRYLLCYGLLLGFIFYLNRQCKVLTPTEWKLIIGFILISVILKQVGFGFYNDFASKTTFLVLFILNAYFIKLLFLNIKIITKLAKVGILSFIGISSIMSVLLIAFKINSICSNSKAQSYGFSNPKYLLFKGKPLILKEVLIKVSKSNNYPFIIQYLGQLDQFGRKVCKK